MLQWIRCRAGHVAAALVLSLAALGIPHSADPNHDADYAVGILAGDTVWVTQLTAGDSDAENHSHCVACHATRSGWTRVQLRHAAPSSQAISLSLFAVITARSADSIALPSLRAPPASPVLS